VTLSGKGASVRAVNVTDQTHLDFKLILKGNVAHGPLTVSVRTGGETVTGNVEVRAVSQAWWTTDRPSGQSFLARPAAPLQSPSMHRSTEIGINARPIDPRIETTTLPGGTVGGDYSAGLEGAGGKAPYTWTANSRAQRTPSGIFQR
jgi:hypothetical protein